MIVVDTSVLVYLYVAGEHTPRAETALARDPEWAAPLLWRSEFRSALMGFVRLRGLALEDAIQVSDEAERRMTGHEYMVVSHRVLQLAARSGCSPYDCEFVALAEDLGIPFVTTDRQVLAAFPARATALDAFARARRS